MKIITVLLLFFSWISCTSLIFGQQPGMIRGQVMDTTGLPMDGAVVSLLKAADSVLVKTNVTEPDGKFEFDGLEPGRFLLVISAFGYQSHFSDPLTIDSNTLSIELPVFQFAPQVAQKLEEVAVIARIPLIQRKIDRTVVNVDAMISGAGSNALEILEKSPGVLVDQSGTIMLKGKAGVLIYIDDKPTYLSGTALQNYLKSLPASVISQVEIMTNPPAKYDAAGNVGIINIVTKKSKLKGFNGSISISQGQGKYVKSNHSFNFNYRNNKLNVFGTLSGGGGINFNDLYINRTYRNEDLTVKSYFNQNTKSKDKNLYGSARFGADYYLSEKSTLGISMSGTLSASKAMSRNISLISGPLGNLTSTVIADNSEKSDFKSGGINLNFRHKYDSTGKLLTMDMDYVRYGTLSDQAYLNNTYTPEGELAARDQLDGTLPAKINIFAFKADYSHPLKKDAKVEAGFKTSYTSIDNLVDYYNTTGGVSTPDYDKSNHFKYDEMINAAYLNFNKDYKRFAFQTGLRAEGTISNGNQLGNPAKPTARFKRDYLNIFPTAYLSYKLDSVADNQLILSYGRRIDRPYYEDLNPFVRPLDKFTFYSGNPLLRPMISQNLSFTYAYKSYFSIILTHSRTKNEISETIEIDENSLYFSRPGNIGKSAVSSIAAESTIPFAKWLSTSVYTEVTNTHYKGQLYTETLDSRGTYFYFYLNNSFKLAKGWSAELSGFYISRLVSAQFTLAQRGQVTVAVQKKILKDKASVKLSVRDIFYTQVNNGIINNLRLTDANYTNRYDSRTLFISFSWSFGKPFVSQPKHEGSGSESEQKRVKS